MKIPNFTAEASLCERSGHHVIETDWADTTAAQAILPQDYCWTKTACTGFVLWCRNRCKKTTYPYNEYWKGWWYPCGGCFGFSW